MNSPVPEYLTANNDYYSRFWTENPLYSLPFPNADEAARASVILELLSRELEGSGHSDKRLRILDVGCGRGWLTQLLSTYGDAAGIEPTPTAVEMAKNLFPHLRFDAGLLDNLLKEARFEPYDLVVCSEVIEHIPRELKPSFVRDLSRALLPGALSIVTTPRREMWDSDNPDSSQLIEDWLTESELQTMFLQEGFVLLQSGRAFPVRRTLLDRMQRRCSRMFAWVVLDWIEKGLEYRSGLYQVCLFRKSAAP